MKTTERKLELMYRYGEAENLDTETCKMAIEKYGSQSQINMLFEEIAELQKEICKYLRGRDNRLEIAEEIADVEIVLEQMKLLFDIEDGVDKFKTIKMERLKERLR